MYVKKLKRARAYAHEEKNMKFNRKNEIINRKKRKKKYV